MPKLKTNKAAKEKDIHILLQGKEKEQKQIEDIV